MPYMKRSQKKRLTTRVAFTSLLLMVAVHVRDIITHIITLSGARGNKWVKLIVQLMHLLMQVVIVGLCIHNMLHELNLSSPQDIFHVPGFIPLVQHMNQHALIVSMCKSQALHLISQGTDILHCHLIPMSGLVPL
jgi:hypothetical protein